MSTETIDFYRALIPALGAELDDSAKVIYGNSPITLKGREWVLPERQYLSRAEWDKYIAFHPLSETNSGKITPTLERIVKLMEFRLNSCYVHLAEALVRISSDVELSNKLQPKHAARIVGIGTLNQKDAKFLISQLEKLDQSEIDIVRIKFEKDQKLNGEEVTRLSKLRVPFLEQLRKDDSRCVSANYTSKKQHPALLAIFEALLGVERATLIAGYEESEDYSSGTSTYTAPLLTCLLGTYAMALEDIRVLQGMLRPALREMDSDLLTLDIDTSWIEYRNRFQKIKDEVPALEGNYSSRASDGLLMQSDNSTHDEPERRKISSLHSGPTNPPQAPQAQASFAPMEQAPIQQPQQPQPSQGGAMSLDEIISGAGSNYPYGNQYQQPQQPMYQQPQHQGYNQPMYQQPQQPMYQQPQQQMYQQPQQPMYQQPQQPGNHLLNSLQQVDAYQNGNQPQMQMQYPQYQQDTVLDIGMRAGVGRPVQATLNQGMYYR